MITVYDLFTSPQVSRQLKAMGLSQKTLATLRGYHDGEYLLVSAAFDGLQLYKELPLTGYKSAYEELATYSVQEIARVLPGFTLTTDGSLWTACGSSTYRIPCVSHARMADAAGLCLVRTISERLITLSSINSLFENQNINH